MAKRESMKCELIDGVLVWSNRTTGETLFQFRVSSVSDSVRDRVYHYGLRQILADAGADADDLPARLRAMFDRSMALQDGTWGTRASMPDADIFLAAVRCARIPSDSPASREKWRALTPKQRRAVGCIPDVAAAMTDNGPAADDAADILSIF